MAILAGSEALDLVICSVSPLASLNHCQKTELGYSQNSSAYSCSGERHGPFKFHIDEVCLDTNPRLDDPVS